MFWPHRGQLPLLSCIILMFSYYFSNGWQMQNEGMVIKDTLDKIKDKEPSCTSTIVENFNDFTYPTNVLGTLQELEIYPNSTCLVNIFLINFLQWQKSLDSRHRIL
uniref:Uncharacterized protein n=1 Tax=Meloidogyne floridensis TaxID=298350 RepID=A0A915PAR5_9BILA